MSWAWQCDAMRNQQPRRPEPVNRQQATHNLTNSQKKSRIISSCSTSFCASHRCCVLVRQLPILSYPYPTVLHSDPPSSPFSRSSCWSVLTCLREQALPKLQPGPPIPRLNNKYFPSASSSKLHVLKMAQSNGKLAKSSGKELNGKAINGHAKSPPTKTKTKTPKKTGFSLFSIISRHIYHHCLSQLNANNLC